MPKTLFFEDVSVGTEVPLLQRHPTKRQLVQWSGATENFAPIHYDNDLAKSWGLPAVNVHGRLKAAFLAEMLSSWTGRCDSLKKLSVTYRRMDFPNAALTCRGIVTRTFVDNGEGCVTCEIRIENAAREVTTKGSALVVLPRRTQTLSALANLGNGESDTAKIRDETGAFREIYDAIGVAIEPYVVPAESRLVSRLLKATDAANPSSPGASSSEGNDRYVPPSFLLSLMVSGGRPSQKLPRAVNSALSDAEISPEAPFSYSVDGGGEWEFISPIYKGDVVTTNATLDDVYEKTGGVGKMLFVELGSIHRNQNSKVVAQSKATYILY